MNTSSNSTTTKTDPSPCTNFVLNKLLTGTLNASINPFATEFIGTPFHNVSM